MAEKVNSTHEIEKIEETIKQINDINNNFGAWLKNGLVKNELAETLQWIDKRLALHKIIKLLDSIKEKDFDGRETQKKTLMDSLISKKWILKSQMKKNKHYKKR